GLYTIGVYSKEADRPKNGFFEKALHALTPLNYYQQLKNDSHAPGATGEAPEWFPFDADLVTRVEGGLVVPGWTWGPHVTYGTAFMASTIDDQFQRYAALQAQYHMLLQGDQAIRSQIAQCFADQSRVVSPPDWCNADMVHYLTGTGTFSSPGPREAS